MLCSFDPNTFAREVFGIGLEVDSAYVEGVSTLGFGVCGLSVIEIELLTNLEAEPYISRKLMIQHKGVTNEAGLLGRVYYETSEKALRKSLTT